MLISGITIEIIAYLLSRELEVDLSRSNVDVALVVLRNGLQRMMGISYSSSPMSGTMKSVGAN